MAKERLPETNLRPNPVCQHASSWTALCYTSNNYHFLKNYSGFIPIKTYTYFVIGAKIIKAEAPDRRS